MSNLNILHIFSLISGFLYENRNNQVATLVLKNPLILETIVYSHCYVQRVGYYAITRVRHAPGFVFNGV